MSADVLTELKDLDELKARDLKDSMVERSIAIRKVKAREENQRSQSIDNSQESI